MITYENYEKLIYKLAHSWESPSVCFDDLLSTGNETFVIASQKFNPNNGNKFSTYLYSAVSNAMNDLATEAISKSQIETEIPTGLSTNSGTSPEHMAIFKSWVDGLSSEAQFILDTVWNTPIEIVQWAREESYNPKTTLKLVSRYLRDLGWTWAIIREGFLEIREQLKNL